MKTLLSQILEPMLRRVGSITAGGLVTLGATQSDANLISMAVVAALGIAIDLVLSSKNINKMGGK